MPAKLDITGNIFGKLTVIGKSPNGPSGQTKWICRCECGSTKSIMTNSLMLGRTKSCGCNIIKAAKSRIKNISGKRFGALVVIDLADCNKSGAYWNCICDCGKKMTTWGTTLRNGVVKSCGCQIHLVRDLSGQKFGMLNVIKRNEDRGFGAFWLCKCDCGNESV